MLFSRGSRSSGQDEGAYLKGPYTVFHVHCLNMFAHAVFYLYSN